MQLAANDDKLSESANPAGVRDDRLERARKLLRPVRQVARPNTGPLLASACLAGAALLLASLVTGGQGGHPAAPAPALGSDLAPSVRPLREAAPSAGHADFELSASSGANSAAPAEAMPVRDAILIGTEGEGR
jgi:hypothetical protein